MSEVVTGDAVVLDVRVAQLPVRAVGALIDIAVILVGYLLALMLWAATLSQFDDAVTAAIMIIFTVLVFVGYPLVFETATRGRTVGKIVMGLRVVSDDGGPERFRQALFRALASVVEIWMLLGSPAVICSMLSPKAKRIGDIFAGTVVISERGPKLGPPPTMPPSLAWWAASLQLSGLGADQAEVARQFLSRARQLDPQLRDQMAYRIASDVLSRVAPPPPPGTPPQLLLAAVLAERHRRELARLRPFPTGPAPWSPSGGPPSWPIDERGLAASVTTAPVITARELLRDSGNEDDDVGNQQCQSRHRNQESPSAPSSEERNNDREGRHHRSTVEQHVEADPVGPQVRALLIAAGGRAHHGAQRDRHDDHCAHHGEQCEPPVHP